VRQVKNIAKIFQKASKEDCILFFDEFDSLGKIRDYDQDHGEMKRVVNTILQLIDYLPQETLMIAATNQIDMLDDALLRRFDLILQLERPTQKQIEQLVKKVLVSSKFKFSFTEVKKIIPSCKGLSYYSIQKTLTNAMKKSYLNSKDMERNLDLNLWKALVVHEKKAVLR
jgi:SpoVK/Ycf46/Vps4 family AAA+-type ATPase